MDKDDKENKTSENNHWKPDADDSSNASSASSNALEIVTQDEPSTSLKPRKRKACENMPQELENMEEEIEEQLSSKAKKSKLTVKNVKNILRHVITNQHVMAMVKKSMKESGEADSSDEECPYEPKLTRAKTKELLQTQPNIPWPVTPSKPPPVSETKILIDSVLPDDEEDDDEYQPAGDEEEMSDDEAASLLSDLDPVLTPQPATPQKCSNTDCSTQTAWTEDGIFKLPITETTAEAENLESIGQRTRSKFSLSDTALETIEQSFVPPDITTDMYDLECDNEDWRNFLEEFTKPLNSVANETLDDDEADPEYNILEDEEAVDKEELRADRAVKVSKKEYNELISELMEYMESSDEEGETNTNKSMDCSVMNTSSNFQCSTPNSSQNESILGLESECSFAALRASNNQAAMSSNDQRMFGTPQTPNSFQQRYYNSASPQVAPGSYYLPPVVVSSPVHNNKTVVTVMHPGENSTEMILPDSNDNEGFPVTTEKVAETGIVKFGYDQRLLLTQQMAQHVQLLAQSYMQSSIVPEMSCCTSETKENLLSLKYLGGYNKESAFYAVNLNDAITAVEEWDTYLEEGSPQAAELKKFTEDEAKRRTECRAKKIEFVPRLCDPFLKVVGNNKAFMYPLLLPTHAFLSRSVVSKILNFTNSEIVLMVYGLEQFIPYIEKNFPLKRKVVSKKQVSDMIAEFMLPAKTSKTIENFINKYITHKQPNPIKNFFLKNEVPVTNHFILCIKPIAPKDQPLELLPKLWREYFKKETTQHSKT